MFEKLEDAVIREVKEEIDVDVKIERIMGVCDHIIEAEKGTLGCNELFM